MKIISISGAHRSIGKTTLARRLKATLDQAAVIVKVGHGRIKEKDEILLHSVEKLSDLIATLKVPYLLIESNQAHEVAPPDFSIYIDALDKPPKASAAKARERADIIIDESLEEAQVTSVLSQKAFFSRRIAQRVQETLMDFHRDFLERKRLQ